jgi:hypothetical protein
MSNIKYENKCGGIIDLDGVREKYFSYWKIKDIAKHYNCSWQQIGKIVWKEIPSRRPHKYKYNINHKYFDSIDTEEKAYILGFICADGCVSKTSHSQLTISLQYRDVAIVERIKFLLGSTSPIEIYRYENKKYCRISFYSKRMCDCLKILGCGPLKSDNLLWNGENFPSTLIRHFIRGYFDGDGHFSFWLYKNKYLKSHFNITSTMEFCKGLSTYINKLFGYNCYMSQRNKDSYTNNRTIELSGNKQIISIMKWLYEDATIFLDRKQVSFDKFTKIYEK